MHAQDMSSHKSFCEFSHHVLFAFNWQYIPLALLARPLSILYVSYSPFHVALLSFLFFCLSLHLLLSCSPIISLYTNSLSHPFSHLSGSLFSISLYLSTVFTSLHKNSEEMTIRVRGCLVTDKTHKALHTCNYSTSARHTDSCQADSNVYDALTNRIIILLPLPIKKNKHSTIAHTGACQAVQSC